MVSLVQRARGAVRAAGAGVVAPVAAAHLVALAFLPAARAMFGGSETGRALLAGAVVHWDAVHYLDIAASGYAADHLAVFLPLYPALVRAAGWLLGDLVLAALLVSGVAHVWAAHLLYRLVALDEPEAVARRAVLALVAFPTALAAVLPYTEGLFLALTLGSVLAFRTRRYWTAALLAGLATLTRLPGLALVGLLGVEYLVAQRREVRWTRAAPAVLAPLVGFAVYLAINAAAYGEALHFLEVQRQTFTRSLGWPGTGLRQAWSGFRNRPHPDDLTVGLSDLVGGVLAWAGAVYAARRLRPSYAVFGVLSAALITFQTWWLSNLRYCYVIFPLHIAAARLTGREWIRWGVIGVGLAVQALLAVQFARGWWSM